MGQPSLSPGRQRIGKTRGLAEPDSLALAPRRDPDGCQYSVSSCCGEVVRVQEAAESVASLESRDSGERGWWRRWLGCDGWAAAERSVRALGVVVVDVDAQDAVELPWADDQQPVQALGPRGPDEALGVCVGLWRAERRLDHRDALGAKDLVESAGELESRSRISNAMSPSAALRLRLRACWATQRPSGFAVAPARWTRRVCSSMKNSSSSGAATRSRRRRSRRRRCLPPARAGTHARRAPNALAPDQGPRARAAGEPCSARPEAELVELARDPLVAPAGILARQPQHELARGRVDRRAPRPRT